MFVSAFVPDTHWEYQAVLTHLPEFYRGPVTFAYHTGWREGEVLDLGWSNVDFQENTVTLDVGSTKNDESRVIYSSSIESVFGILLMFNASSTARIVVALSGSSGGM